APRISPTHTHAHNRRSVPRGASKRLSGTSHVITTHRTCIHRPQIHPARRAEPPLSIDKLLTSPAPRNLSTLSLSHFHTRDLGRAHPLIDLRGKPPHPLVNLPLEVEGLLILDDRPSTTVAARLTLSHTPIAPLTATGHLHLVPTRTLRSQRVRVTNVAGA